MKKLVILTAMLLAAGCSWGPNGSDFHNHLEMPYNDDAFKENREAVAAEQVLQDARLTALEVRIAQLEAGMTGTSELYNATMAVINDLQVQITTGAVNVLPICSSGESLIKTSQGIYAVYMVSNNFGTYLGMLSENVAYQTTDTSHTHFMLVNNEVICQ